jgi:hypothetical protein
VPSFAQHPPIVEHASSVLACLLRSSHARQRALHSGSPVYHCTFHAKEDATAIQKAPHCPSCEPVQRQHNRPA